MVGTSWRLRCAAAVAAGLTAASVFGPVAGVAQAAPASGPRVKLVVAQRSISVPRYGRQVFLDPGIWVASLGSALELDVQRPDYATPLTVTQVVHLPGGGTQQIPWPASVVGKIPSGLRNFVQMTVRNSRGRVVGSRRLEFCPDSFDPERSSPSSPSTSPYPQLCVGDPFPKSLVWGVAKGWAVDPAETNFTSFRLGLGHYTVTDTITPTYTQLLGIPAASASATVRVTVAKGSGCCGQLAAPATRPRSRPQSRPLASAPAVPDLQSPPARARPDLVPLPSWGIFARHLRKTKRSAASDQLDFGATVSVGGNAPLDVEGFRSNGSPIMKAYQYFSQNGKIIGRARAGTMGFDSKKGHNHWHFEQFAQYRLLNSQMQLAVRSHKVGFCIAPTDPVDLLLPAAEWQPTYLGFGGGQCGSPTALWVREQLPVGWADTYFQSVAGQSFNITGLCNGTYYIEVIANPQHVLYETDTSNDVSLRKVILGGKPGHRTVRVPAYDGIDPEG
jgi:Lysyl oxidase